MFKSYQFMPFIKNVDVSISFSLGNMKVFGRCVDMCKQAPSHCMCNLWWNFNMKKVIVKIYSVEVHWVQDYSQSSGSDVCHFEDYNLTEVHM